MLSGAIIGRNYDYYEQFNKVTKFLTITIDITLMQFQQPFSLYQAKFFVLPALMHMTYLLNLIMAYPRDEKKIFLIEKL